MIMKFTDLMLDYATGDACIQDAYIQEALGQIEVSNKIYEAAVEIMDLDANELAYVQEAATEAGLPTDVNEGLECVQEAFNRSSKGFLNLIQQTTSKLGTAADKSWQAICGAAKITGVPTNLRDSDLDEFASATAHRIAQKADNDGVYIGRGFKDGTSLRTKAGIFMKSIQDCLPAFGLKGNVDYVVKEYVSTSESEYVGGDLNKFIIALEYATAAMDTPIRTSDYVTESDIADYIKTAYTLKTFCESVTEGLNSDSVKSTGAVYAAQAAGNGNRSRQAMSEMSRAAKRIIGSTNTLTKTLNDSGYAIGEALNRGSAPLPQKKQYA